MTTPVRVEIQGIPSPPKGSVHARMVCALPRCRAELTVHAEHKLGAVLVAVLTGWRTVKRGRSVEWRCQQCSRGRR